jgi:hypothetical protein
MINGFTIDANGKVLVSIEREPQIWSEAAAIIVTLYTARFVMVALVWKHIIQSILYKVYLD